MPEVLIYVEETIHPPTDALIAGIENAMRESANHLQLHIYEQKTEPLYGKITAEKYVLNDERMRLAIRLASEASRGRPDIHLCAYVMPTTFAVMERTTQRIVASCNAILIATATEGEPIGFTIELVGTNSIPEPVFQMLQHQVGAMTQGFVRREPASAIVVDSALVAKAISAGIEFGVTGKPSTVVH